jgi:hypothetical protein
MLSAIKVMKYLFLCLIGSKIHVKVTKILIICCKKFCEYPPSVLNFTISTLKEYTISLRIYTSREPLKGFDSSPNFYNNTNQEDCVRSSG